MNVSIWRQFYGKKETFKLDTPLKPWTRISLTPIGCVAPTDNTCLTPSSKLTPVALEKYRQHPFQLMHLVPHSCSRTHRVAAALIADPRWTLADTDWHRRTHRDRRALSLSDLRREGRHTAGDAMLVKLAVALLVLSVLEQAVGTDNIDFHDLPPEKPATQKGRLSLQNTGKTGDRKGEFGRRGLFARDTCFCSCKLKQTGRHVWANSAIQSVLVQIPSFHVEWRSPIPMKGDIL